MKFAVISSAPFVTENDGFYAYSPYVKEIEIWAKYVTEFSVMCPVLKNSEGMLVSRISFPIANIYEAKAFNVKSFSNLLKALFFAFQNFLQIYRAMVWADHIHLRCPGNIGLMACLIQVFFPFKAKTAKYAGNWDPMAKQPLSYRIQKWILSNTFLTRNMQVLVYGHWERSTKNIKPFFTATYKDSDKMPIAVKPEDTAINFLFVGTLAPGKGPLYAIQLVESLHLNGHDVSLDIFGNGSEKSRLKDYINSNKLNEIVSLKDNQPLEIVQKAYQQSHFLILPSKSEGWPKVVAEAMFWGCVPLTTPVSCVPDMIANGKRGLLLKMDLRIDTQNIVQLLSNRPRYVTMSLEAAAWSQKYTLDLFESEIEALLHQN
ncbi:MAG TPA: glycosyltransferase [Flavobacterium sp.]|jgi:glycosyltransferase involved in cell wall biosynthesis